MKVQDLLGDPEIPTINLTNNLLSEQAPYFSAPKTPQHNYLCIPGIHPTLEEIAIVNDCLH